MKGGEKSERILLLPLMVTIAAKPSHTCHILSISCTAFGEHHAEWERPQNLSFEVPPASPTTHTPLPCSHSFSLKKLLCCFSGFYRALVLACGDVYLTLKSSENCDVLSLRAELKTHREPNRCQNMARL